MNQWRRGIYFRVAMKRESFEQRQGPWVTVIVVRHGQTEWNEQGRWQGRLDSPLTPLGRQQARQARDTLAGCRIDAVYSSDAGRALETARILTEGRGLPIMPEPALRERNCGAYEGMLAAEIEKQHPSTRFSHTGGSRETWAPPRGESMAQVRERIRPFLLSLVAKHAGQTVLLVTHAGVMRAVDSLCRNASFDAIWYRVPPNAGIYVARVYADGRFENVWDNLPDTQPDQDAAPAPAGR